MDYSYSYEYYPTDAAAASGLMGWIAAMGVFAAIFGIAVYVYMSLALMKIAQRNNTPNAWLAWIPIGNLYLMTQIAQVPWWTMLVIFLSWIPVIGWLGVVGVTVWWWMKISERMGKPNWWGILMIVPIANFIIPGILAWGKEK